jgi:hypothetical protein
MKILYIVKNPFKGTIILPPGCTCIIIDPNEGHIAEAIIGGLMQMEVSQEHYAFLYSIYEKVRVTHDKSEEQ